MLTDRQNYILSTIIELYEKNGEPIGSKTLLSLSDLDYSSATIRNEMKVLEDVNLIEKTHTSSGRVPTNDGYRYYVQRLLKRQPFQAQQASKKRLNRRKKLYQLYNQSFQQIDEIMNITASILSQLTSYTAIVLGPEAENSKLVAFRFVPINAKVATGIIVTDTGKVNNLLFELPAGVQVQDIEKMITIIEEELVGSTLLEAYQKIQFLIPKLMQRYASSAYSLIEVISGAIGETLAHPVKVSGRINILDAVDDLDFKRFKLLYTEMDNNAAIVKLLAKNPFEKLNIQIGPELDNELLDDFTLISSGYDVSQHGQGLIAILGPRKMPYSMTIQLLEDVSDILPDVFSQFYRDEN